MGEKEMHTDSGKENMKERGQLEELSIDGNNV
jgi:hypothetical protein